MAKPAPSLNDWSVLLRLADGEDFTVERVRLAGTGVSIEGEFAPPPLARLRIEDQVFIAAFVRAHGSIKDMETMFGVSYPTIKARLNRISGALSLVDEDPGPSRASILDDLEAGRITPEDAAAALQSRSRG
jgi:hypothetical protein